MKKSIFGHKNISLAAKYKIVQAAITTPIVPEIKTFWDSVFFKITNDDLKMTSWCEFKLDNKPVHHLRVENDAKNSDIPGRHYTNGLLSKLVYTISTYRYEHENLNFILNWKTSKISHPNRFYNKLNRDVQSVESGCSVMSLDQKTSAINLFSTIVDGYRITTRENIDNATGKSDYSLIISDSAAGKRMTVLNENAKKIFILLQKKKQRVM